MSYDLQPPVNLQSSGPGLVVLSISMISAFCVLAPHLPKKFERGEIYKARITATAESQVTLVRPQSGVHSTVEPLTPLVAQLLQIRQRAIANGMKLLSYDEILQEVAHRRGEVD